MKQSTTEILATLKMQPSANTKKYASKLSSLFVLINEIEKMDLFKVQLTGRQGNCQMVKALPVLSQLNYKIESAYLTACQQQYYCKNIFGEFKEWDIIIVSFANGSYKFPLPTGNKYYDMFCSMAGLETIKDVTPKNVIINTITVESKVLKNLSIATKFISKDDLRPSMMHVLIAMENYQLEIVSTDAHRMYYSKKVECSQKERLTILVNEKTAKAIAKIKFTEDISEIMVLKGNKIMIEGQIFDCGADMNYPDYRCVIPTYNTFMEFNKEQFVNNVKKVLPSANKATKQVTFHLNGSISLNACAVDFSYESAANMPYIYKNFTDTDIAFSGNFLIDVMGAFKDKTVKMYSNGESNKAALFTNDIDTVLLMPLLINN